MYIPLFFVREFKREWEWGVECFLILVSVKSFFLVARLIFSFLRGGGG